MESTWTQEKRDLANEKYYFIVVTPIGLKHVNITDIQAVWALYPEFLIHTNYRIAGNKGDIANVMSENGYDEDQIADLLEETIGADNFESEDKADAYQEEVDGYAEWKDQVIANNKGAKGMTLTQLLEKINPHMIQERKLPVLPSSRVTPSGKPSPTKGKVGRKSNSLQEKIDNLDDGKILNISNITNTGTGTVTKDRPNKTSLFVAPNLPFITNNLESILIAVNLIGGEEEHQEDVDAARAHFENKGAKKTPGGRSSSKPISTLPPKALNDDNVHEIPHSNTIVPEAVQPLMSRFAKRNIIPEEEPVKSTVTAKLPRDIPKPKPLVLGTPKKEEALIIPENDEV
jgi:hypothetical protein